MGKAILSCLKAPILEGKVLKTLTLPDSALPYQVIGSVTLRGVSSTFSLGFYAMILVKTSAETILNRLEI